MNASGIDAINQPLCLSKLSVNVILDHAGGHNSATRRRALSRDADSSLSTATTINTPSTTTTSTHPTDHEERALRPLHDDTITKLFSTSPTRKKNKKLYIRLKEDDRVTQAAAKKPSNSQSKGTTVLAAKSNEALLVVDASTQGMSRRQPRSTTLRVRRRNSTGSIHHHHGADANVKKTASKTRRQSLDLHSSSSTQRTAPSNDTTMEEAIMRKAQYTLPRKHRSPSLMDSPMGTYRRIPRGYQPLCPDIMQPLVSSSDETSSCTTHSSLMLDRRHLDT